MRTVVPLAASLMLWIAMPACAAAPTSAPDAAPNAKLTALAPGHVLDLGPVNLTPPEGESAATVAKVTDYSTMVYDPNRHQVLMFGGGHATTFTDAIYAFDFKQLKWTALYTPTPRRLMKADNFDPRLGAWKSGPEGPFPRPLSRHTYDLLCVTPGLDELVMLKVGGGITSGVDIGGGGYFGGQWAHYDLAKGVWSFVEPVVNPGYGTCAYDPASRRIVIYSDKGLFTYDPVARTGARALSAVRGAGYANHLVHYPPNGRMYDFNRNDKSVWEIVLNREDFSKSTVEKVETTGDYPSHGEPGYAYDDQHKTIGGALKDNRFHTFDPRTKAWTSREVQGGRPGTMEFHAIAYNPADKVYILIAGRHTWAYRPAAP